MKKQAMEEFFDMVQSNGLTIEETIELVQLYIADFRDGVLEDKENFNIKQSIKLLQSAKELISEIEV